MILVIVLIDSLVRKFMNLTVLHVEANNSLTNRQEY